MRGKEGAVAEEVLDVGITPAYAGKRQIRALGIIFHEDHPRVCGEKLSTPSSAKTTPGSPPRMRGKVSNEMNARALLRITPAYAGKSSLSVSYSHPHKDHPRVCGEKKSGSAATACSSGSPPRMRGKDLRNLVKMSFVRITPAYAGKRLKRSRSTVPHAAIVPLFPSVYNKPAGSDGSPAGHDAPPFLPIENAAPASPAYNLRSL